MSVNERDLDYLNAAKFETTETSGRAYFEAQLAISRSKGTPISVFRFKHDDVWHVALLGDHPPKILTDKIDYTMSANGGSKEMLSDDLVTFLKRLRAEAIKQGWVEKHDRPL